MSLGCAAASAQAQSSWFSLEGGVGASYYSHGPDDLWWQESMQHDFHLSAPAWRLGIQLNAVDYHPGSWIPGVAAHLIYLNFGQASIRSEAAPDEDPTVYNATRGGYYSPQTHSCDKTCGPLRNFVSGGRLQSFALTVEPYWEHNGWRFGLEAGPTLNYATWDASATAIDGTPYWGPAGSVETFHHVPSWKPGALVGASVGYGPVTVRYEYVWSSVGAYNSTTVPTGFKGAHMLTIGYRF